MRSTRPIAAVGCVPRRTDLPLGATTGVECHPADSLVAAVGIYGFAGSTTREPALAAYLHRMKKQDVATRSGGCAKGRPGDHAWPADLPDEGDDGSGLRPTRASTDRDPPGICARPD